MRGQCPQLQVAATRAEEFDLLTERIRSWLAAGIEAQAIGVTARSASLVREAREALRTDGIATAALNGRAGTQAVRAGTMHAMKGLEFQAVAVIGVEQDLVPEPAAVTPASEDAVAHAQDMQRERCVLFVACTRARDHLYVSATGEPSMFLRFSGGGQSHRLGPDAAGRRRHRTGRGQPYGDLRTDPDDRAGLLDAAGQGHARRNDERRAPPALWRR
jgi:hypothetical protein